MQNIFYNYYTRITGKISLANDDKVSVQLNREYILEMVLSKLGYT